jgi:hypothetical protein
MAGHDVEAKKQLKWNTYVLADFASQSIDDSGDESEDLDN